MNKRLHVGTEALPIRMVDNGDGTYSPAVSASVSMGDVTVDNSGVETRLEAVRDRLPSALGPQAASASLSTVAAPTDPIGNGTRAYNFAAATRTSVGSTSSAAVAIGTLGTSRELMLVASTRCFIRWGDSGVTAAAAADADLLPLPADAMFHLRVPPGVTHLRVIRDSADGFLRTIPVA